MREEDKTLLKVIAACFFILMLLASVGNYLNRDKWEVVTNGKGCYSYTSGSFVSSNCYATEAEAREHMQDLISYIQKREDHRNDDWQEIK
jgi:hypothetical protein